MNMITDLLLLHELRIGAVIDDITSKNRSGQDGVNLLGIDILELAVENKVVSRRSNSDSGLLSEEDKGEDIAKLQEWLALK